METRAGLNKKLNVFYKAWGPKHSRVTLLIWLGEWIHFCFKEKQRKRMSSVFGLLSLRRPWGKHID